MRRPFRTWAILLVATGLASRAVALPRPSALLVPCNSPVATLTQEQNSPSKGAKPVQGGLVLRYTSHVGDAATYSMKMQGKTVVWSSAQANAKRQESSIATEMLLRQEVIASTESSIKLRTTINSGTIDAKSGVFGHPAEPVVTTMRPNGEIIENSGFAGLDLKSMQLVFPNRALKIGDSWTDNIPASSSVPTELVVTYTVVGIKRFHGEDCVQIASKVRSPRKPSIEGLELSIQADGDIYFAYRAGRMMKNDVTSKMSMRLRRVSNTRKTTTVTEMDMRMQMDTVVEKPGEYLAPVRMPTR